MKGKEVVHCYVRIMTLYDRSAWVEQMLRFSLLERYPHLIQGLEEGFDLGILPIHHTYTPPNHSSISPLHYVYSNIIKNEFSAGH